MICENCGEKKFIIERDSVGYRVLCVNCGERVMFMDIPNREMYTDGQYPNIVAKNYEWKSSV